LEGLTKNLSTLIQAFADPKRTQAFVKMFDRMDPLIVNMNAMATDVTKLTKELNIIVPQVRAESPELGKELGSLVTELSRLTNSLEPAMREIGPELPRASRRAVEALDQVVITLKAMQKSFLLRGNVEDVKEEEKQRDQQRQPAKQ